MPEVPGGLVDRLLAYANEPWKIGAIAALALIGLLTVTAWEKRADIAEIILHSTITPRLEPGRFTKVVRPLMDETGADVALLLAVQLNNNVARIVAGIKRDDPNWLPPTGPRPIFGATDPAVVEQLIAGITACNDLKEDSPAQTAREMWAYGIRRQCTVSVPPVIDVLVGAVLIGWARPPDPQTEAGTRAEMRRAANQLATW